MLSSIKNVLNVKHLAKLLYSPHLFAIREGLTLTLPIIIVATIAILINTFPSDTYEAIMVGAFGQDWKLFGTYIYNGSYGVISLIMVFSISYSLAEHSNTTHQIDRVNPAIVALVAFSCLLCMMEPSSLVNQGERAPAYIARWLGVHGLLFSTVIAICSCSLFLYLAGIKRLRTSFYTGSSGVAMAQAMNTLVPALLTISLFALVKVLLNKIWGVQDINEVIYHLLYLPFRSLGEDNLSTAMLYGVARHFLWFIGIHGSNVLEPVMQELYLPAIASNIEAGIVPYYFGDALIGKAAIFTKPFFDCYTSLGGAGSTIGLLLACMIAHQDSGAIRVAKISIFPSIFNINEILLFGLPVVLNPIFIVPFLLTPLLCTVTATFATVMNLVPLTTSQVAWNIPIFLNAYEATGSIRGSLLQLFNIALATAAYIPFVLFDKQLKSLEFKKNFNRLTAVALDSNSPDVSQDKLLSLPNPIGTLAQSIATDMLSAISRNEVYFQYQPQVDSCTGRVIGVESLIRWNHPNIGMIPPPVLIGLAEETGYIEKLGMWSLEQSAKQLAEWKKVGMKDIVMSANVSFRQIKNSSFPDKVAKILYRYNVDASEFKIELTESFALSSPMIKNRVLSRLHDMGIHLAIDDFGMGHSSIVYVKQFNVDSIKIDALLTRDVLASKTSCDIIASIVDLCKTMNISIISEYVENEAHLLRLRELGCCNIQGYYYSPPLMPDECLQFINKKHKAFGPIKI